MNCASSPEHMLGLPGPSLLPIQCISASEFSWETLTQAYNQTRVDYIVPMPMNPARLREYVHNYDVDMDSSVVAMEGTQILGLAMLGVRPGHSWATRLGILPIQRRHGVGQQLMESLIERSRQLAVDYVILEVIRGNTPAHRLFCKLGFRETRELLVVRRPPGRPALEVPPYETQAFGQEDALALLEQRRSNPSWLDEIPSLRNAGYLGGLGVELQDGSRGWIVYQNTVFQLGRLVLQTEVGDPYEVGKALLHALHSRYPILDTKLENFPVDDPHWGALQAMNYLEAFRRIEMKLVF